MERHKAGVLVFWCEPIFQAPRNSMNQSVRPPEKEPGGWRAGPWIGSQCGFCIDCSPAPQRQLRREETPSWLRPPPIHRAMFLDTRHCVQQDIVADGLMVAADQHRYLT